VTGAKSIRLVTFVTTTAVVALIMASIARFWVAVATGIAIWAVVLTALYAYEHFTKSPRNAEG